MPSKSQKEIRIIGQNENHGVVVDGSDYFPGDVVVTEESTAILLIGQKRALLLDSPDDQDWVDEHDKLMKASDKRAKDADAIAAEKAEKKAKRAAAAAK
jgi:hypothetical protein